MCNQTRTPLTLTVILNPYRYYCRACWQWQHSADPGIRNHKPITRNSKSQNLVGIGPQQTANNNNLNGSDNNYNNNISQNFGGYNNKLM